MKRKEKFIHIPNQKTILRHFSHTHDSENEEELNRINKKLRSRINK